MADLNEFGIGDFDANEVDPSNCLPDGKYEACIVGTEERDTKAGTGKYLAITIHILGPDEYKNRLLWHILNLVNESQQAVSIARAELSAICRAIGVRQPQDTSELHDRPFRIQLKIKKRSDDDSMENRITKWMPANETR